MAQNSADTTPLSGLHEQLTGDGYTPDDLSVSFLSNIGIDHTTEFEANAGDEPLAIDVKTLASSQEARDAKDLEDRMISYLVIYGVAVAILIAVVLILKGTRRARY